MEQNRFCQEVNSDIILPQTHLALVSSLPVILNLQTTQVFLYIEAPDSQINDLFIPVVPITNKLQKQIPRLPDSPDIYYQGRGRSVSVKHKLGSHCSPHKNAGSSFSPPLPSLQYNN